MKRWKTLCWLGLVLSFSLEGGGVCAQADEAEIETPPTLESQRRVASEAFAVTAKSRAVRPSITANDYVRLGEGMVFDAGNTTVENPAAGTVEYQWDFGVGQGVESGKNVEYVYTAPGRYEVTLRVTQGDFAESVKRVVTVYNRRGVIITAGADTAQRNLIDQAESMGFWLRQLEVPVGASGFSTEEAYERLYQENWETLRESDTVIWAAGPLDDAQAFGQLWQRTSTEAKFDPKGKLWVALTETPLSQAQKLVQPVFATVGPAAILLTRSDALGAIFRTGDRLSLQDSLTERGIEYLVVDERLKTNPLLVISRLLSHFVANGISQNVVYLLLAVPFIAVVISFFRQFVGVSTFGVFTPLMLGVSFLVLGLEFGLLVFAVILAVSLLIRLVFARVEILYIPKVSLTLSVLALSFFLVLALAVAIGTSLDLSLAIFPMLVMATVSEKFLAAQSTGGVKKAAITAGETVLVAIVGYLLVTWPLVKSLVLSKPEWILAPIILNYALGQYTGLRLSEYLKFRALFDEGTSEE